MGILRTDTISGLETPTPVTGSVFFDGSGDYLSIASSDDFAFNNSDFTIEFWMNTSDNTRSDGTFSQSPFAINGEQCRIYIGGSDGIFGFKYRGTDSGTSFTCPENQWIHIALVRRNSVIKFFKDGIPSTSTLTDSGGNTIGSLTIGAVNISAQGPFLGYISNLRVLKGTALYTENFTPPTRELKPIGDTVLLCCNNPDSAGAEATGKTITVNGDAVASTFSSGLTRDFTYGTQFDGVSRFDTQGYFVPPSGTTEQRGRGRGIIAGGFDPSALTNTIDFIQIHSSGNGQDFGDLTQAKQSFSGTANSTRGIFASGYNSPVFSPTNNTDRIEYITIASQGNGVTFGTLASEIRYASCAASSTRGLIAGGFYPSYIDRIEYITIASLGNAQTFGTLTAGGTATDKAGLSSPTRALFAGGNPQRNTIDYVTIATLGDAQDFGDLTAARRRSASASSGTRGLVAGGSDDSSRLNTIDYVTIASTGNAQDFGDLTTIRDAPKGQVCSLIRGVFGGGYSSPSRTNTIDYVTIASTGNAQDFGDMTRNAQEAAGCSDSHGGLS